MKNAGLILESTRQENGSFRINVESCGEFSEGDAGAHVLYLAQLFAKAFRCPVYSVLAWAAELREAELRRELSKNVESGAGATHGASAILGAGDPA